MASKRVERLRRAWSSIWFLANLRSSKEERKGVDSEEMVEIALLLKSLPKEMKRDEDIPINKLNQEDLHFLESQRIKLA